jgi:hypothetical protein
MTTDVQAATDLYGQLKAQARQEARDYILSRTPANLQEEMITVFQADMADIADQLQVPVVVDAPFISQTAAVLSSTLGNWEGSPTSRSYQWKIDGANVGTNAATYTRIAGDIGKTATCVMIATNTAGASAPVTSNAITVV